MSDKAISELIAANQVTPTDLFVLEQSGTAKKLTGQVLENWLVSFADGHGGIQSIQKVGTSGLVDTYRITLSDTTTFDFVVTNGRSITGVFKTGTSGLVDTHTIKYNDGTTSTFTVTNGAKGDKGDNTYTWIKYASQQPTEESHSMGDIPDDWRGEYNGPLSSPPTDWKSYKWYKIKGDKGDTGDPATLANKSVTYQVGDSGSIIPSGTWSSSVPVVPQGKYLWTKTEVQFNTGDPIVSYISARQGIDGSGAVSSVSGVSPDETGNVPLTAADVGALAISGGDMTGPINMNGQPITGLNQPTEDAQAANKGYVDTAKAEAISHANTVVRKAAPRNLLDNSDFRNPVNQRGVVSGSSFEPWTYTLDRWTTLNDSIVMTYGDNGLTVSSEIAQFLLDRKKYAGKKMTAAMKKIDGKNFIVNFTVTDSTNWEYFGLCEDGNEYLRAVGESDGRFTIIIKGTDILWAALYEGEYTAETLPEYQPKGYAVELAECKMYFQPDLLIRSVSSDQWTVYANYVNFPVPMRTSEYNVVFRGFTNGTVGVCEMYKDGVWNEVACGTNDRGKSYLSVVCPNGGLTEGCQVRFRFDIIDDM